jgi:urease beta subunit/urease gamma subunit
MHLLPRERDKLTIVEVGLLAQRRLARGLRLNHPETVGLLALVLLELIRDGRHSVAELMSVGQRILGRRQVLSGIAAMVPEVQVEGTFPDGTKLVTVHHPICAEDGDLALALHGSFLPLPDLAVFGTSEADEVPGAYDIQPGSIDLNAGRTAVELVVTNRSDRPIQVGSHYHLSEVNPYLQLDRIAAIGLRLDIPAGTAVRFEPGESKTIQAVPIAGNRIVRGGNNLIDGPADATRPEVLARLARV